MSTAPSPAVFEICGWEALLRYTCWNVELVARPPLAMMVTDQVPVSAPKVERSTRAVLPALNVTSSGVSALLLLSLTVYTQFWVPRPWVTVSTPATREAFVKVVE